MRTIPPPHEDEIASARFSIEQQAKRAGVDLSSPEMEAFIEPMVAVKAQHMAEIRWLRRLLDNGETL